MNNNRKYELVSIVFRRGSQLSNYLIWWRFSVFRNRKVCVNDTPAYNCRIYYETSSESRLRSLPICLWMLHISRKSRAIFSAYRPVWKQWINFVQRYDDIFSKSQSRSKTGQVTFIVPMLKVFSRSSKWIMYLCLKCSRSECWIRYRKKRNKSLLTKSKENMLIPFHSDMKMSLTM